LMRINMSFHVFCGLLTLTKARVVVFEDLLD
jgi:hypothetical protein